MKQETSEEKTKEQLIQEEATQYYNMAKDYRRDKYLREDQESYIINKLWLKKWKECVNYAYIKRNIQYSYYYSQYSNRKYEPKLDEEPGEIDNSPLLVPLSDFLNDGDLNNPENIVIRHNVNQREEVKIVNKQIWDFLLNKYGGGPEIKKGTIDEKQRYSSTPKKIIEIFYRKYNVVCFPKRKDFSAENLSKLHVETVYISRVKKVSDLKNKITSFKKDSEFYSSEGVTENNLRLWKLSTQVSLETLKQVFMNKSSGIRENDMQFKCGDLNYMEYNNDPVLEELELADTDLAILEYSTETSPWIFEVKKIEQKEGKCEWCNNKKMLRYFCVCKEVWYCREECLEKDKSIHQNRCKKAFEVEENDLNIETAKSRKGLVGLQNLGNTCFMNTSLQCVSNCYELTQYFLKDYYKKDINTDNPIGTGGVLAKAYANFLKHVWYGESGVFSPWNFKKAISTFQSMFTGFQQHDTQEFLNYLLDGLHEDLNRVMKKPLVEKDDSKKDDTIKSREQWNGFLRRNQSTLVDLLYGQYKSTLYCPDSECQNVSTTFDPFLSISLPLVPKTDTYEVICYFIFHNLKIKPLQLNLPFSVETTMMALRNKVAKMLEIHPFSFFIIKMDQQGNYDHIVNSSSLIQTNNYCVTANQRPFFLFQIDPDLFYSNNNKFVLENSSIMSQNRDFYSVTDEMSNRDEENKKLFSDDYEEDESGVTSETYSYYSKVSYNMASGQKHVMSTKVNVDDNYGFNNDFLKTIVSLKKYDDASANMNKRSRIIFPRIIYINKNWTTRQAHFQIFKYFSDLVRRHHDLDESEWPDDKLWLKFFNDYNTESSNDSYECQKKNQWPYRVRIKNHNEGRFEKCYYCESTNCEDCLLPFDDSITIADLIAKIPKNEDMEVDNNFLFMSKHQFSRVPNRDFVLETTWLPEYYKTVHNLNDKRDYVFKILKNDNAPKSVSIYDCFKNFVKLEKLEEDNEWFCPECKKHQKATKKMEMYKSPHILIVHLKRFKNNKKIDTVIDFPINGLNINNYIMSSEKDVPHVYDLFAIANHYGSMGFGHYISFAKNPFDSQWYEFDDSHVSKKTENDLITSSAYVLFYRRRGLENFINLDKIYKKGFIDFEKGVNPDNNMNDTEMETESNSKLNMDNNIHVIHPIDHINMSNILPLNVAPASIPQAAAPSLNFLNDPIEENVLMLADDDFNNNDNEANLKESQNKEQL